MQLVLHTRYISFQCVTELEKKKCRNIPLLRMKFDRNFYQFSLRLRTSNMYSQFDKISGKFFYTINNTRLKIVRIMDDSYWENFIIEKHVESIFLRIIRCILRFRSSINFNVIFFKYFVMHPENLVGIHLHIWNLVTYKTN